MILACRTCNMRSKARQGYLAVYLARLWVRCLRYHCSRRPDTLSDSAFMHQPLAAAIPSLHFLDDNFNSSRAPVFLRCSAMSFPSPAAYASPSSDHVTREASTGQTSAPGKPRPHPCTACKKSKVKCDERRPVCDRCTRREYRVSLESIALSINANIY